MWCLCLLSVAMVAKLTLLSFTVPSLVLVMPLVAFLLFRTASKLRKSIRLDLLPLLLVIVGLY